MSVARALWWRRTLRFRITLVATVVTLVVLLFLAVLTSNLMRPLLVGSADTELREELAAVLPVVAAGRVPDPGPVGMQVHVLDTAGDPVDGRPKPTLDPADVRSLKACTPVLRLGS
jgi:hypothetical protein